MKNMVNMKAIFTLLVAVLILSPGLVCSDAGPPNVITVSSLEDAENLMPVSGVIDSILFDEGHIVISDSLYIMAPDIKYYETRRKPASPDRFVVGTSVGAYLDDESRIKSLYLAKSPQNIGENTSLPPRQKTTPAEGDGFYFENGVFKN